MSQENAAGDENVKAAESKCLYRNFCSILIMMAIGFFLFLLRYDAPLGGDDVGGLVLNNPDSHYLDDRVVVGECELDPDYSLHTTWTRIVKLYFTWDGRIVGRFMRAAVRMIFSLPDKAGWLLFSLYITLFLLIMLLVVVSAACGSIREGLKAPAVMLLAGVLLFYIPSYSYGYMTSLIMYTFTNIYVISVILYLLLYITIRRVYARTLVLQADEAMRVAQGFDKPEACLTAGKFIGINLLGLLAGLSHEAYGVIFGAVLLTQMVRFWLQNHRRISIRYLFMYVGYLVGFCICFFAPGNFNRAQQSHEAPLHTVPLLTRLFNSFYIHAFVAYKIWIVPIIVLPVLLVLFIVLLRKKVLSVKDVWAAVVNNLEWFLGFIMSAITWGLVSRVVSYGMLAANVMLIIGVIRTFHELWLLVTERIMAEKKERRMESIQNFLAGLSVLAVIFLAAGNYSDMSAAHQTAKEWRESILKARVTGAEEITVPAYPEDLDTRFYELDEINDRDKYDRAMYRVVYDTHVVIK
ncbi:MAG: DUF6056 family protein [Eubacterium sp.]|nr:DUF6056 family protein [Eubacterium sp.]